MDFVTGDIVSAFDKLNAKHYIVWWRDYFGADFIGLMLTHSKPSKKFDNILLSPKHIRDGFEFKYDNTHIYRQELIKIPDWGPYEKIGELTEDGIHFIYDAIKDKKSHPDYYYNLENFKTIGTK